MVGRLRKKQLTGLAEPQAEHFGLSPGFSKVQLLQYATTSILFADRGVDTNIIAFNRVILLYGPPGYAAYSTAQRMSGNGLPPESAARALHRLLSASRRCSIAGSDCALRTAARL